MLRGFILFALGLVLHSTFLMVGDEVIAWLHFCNIECYYPFPIIGEVTTWKAWEAIFTILGIAAYVLIPGGASLVVYDYYKDRDRALHEYYAKAYSSLINRQTHEREPSGATGNTWATNGTTSSRPRTKRDGERPRTESQDLAP